MTDKAIDRLIEAVAASHEAGERRIEALERVVERTNQNISLAVATQANTVAMLISRALLFDSRG